MKVVNKDGTEEDAEPVEEESMEDPLDGTWQFDWKDVEEGLKDVTPA